MAVPTFRAATTATATHSGTSGASLVINTPAGVQQDDLLIIVGEFYNNTSTAVVPTPTGWIGYYSDFDAMFMFTKFATASEPASVTLTLPAGQSTFDTTAAFASYKVPFVGHISYFAGDLNVVSNSTSSGVPTFTEAPIGPNSLMFLGYVGDRAGSQGTYTPPAGWNLRASVKSTGTSASVGVVLVDKQAPAGALPACTSSVSLGLWHWATLLITEEANPGFILAMT